MTDQAPEPVTDEELAKLRDYHLEPHRGHMNKPSLARGWPARVIARIDAERARAGRAEATVDAIDEQIAEYFGVPWARAMAASKEVE